MSAKSGKYLYWIRGVILVAVDDNQQSHRPEISEAEAVDTMQVLSEATRS
jgi:hypothetical protein